MSKWLHDVPTLTRRNLLRVGAVAISGFDLMPMLRPLNATVKEKVKPRGTAEYCLYVFLQGGCSHVDSFDLKEGKWTPPDFEIEQVAQGVKMPVGLFPKLSRDFNKIAILRSLETCRLCRAVQRAQEQRHGRWRLRQGSIAPHGGPLPGPQGDLPVFEVL